MSNRSTFSVIIPTYNRASLLVNAVESVANQTFSDWELIVVDDGSKDDTPAVARRLASANSGRLLYVRQENQGKSAALNHGMRHANGEYIVFLDSDDTWLPEKLEWQLRAFKQFGSEYPCFTDAHYVNNPRLPMTAFAFAGRNYAEALGVVQRPASLFDGRRSGLYVQTLAIHREVLKKVGEFDTNLPFGEDTDFFFRLALETPLCYVNKPLVNIDRTESRSDSLVELMVRDEQLRLEKRQYLYEKWLSFLGSDNEYLRKRVLEWIAETHNDRANSHLFAHEYAKACRAISQSLSARFSVKAAAKLALTATVPSLARRAYISRELKRTQERITA